MGHQKWNPRVFGTKPRCIECPPHQYTVWKNFEKECSKGTVFCHFIPRPLLVENKVAAKVPWVPLLQGWNSPPAQTKLPQFVTASWLETKRHFFIDDIYVVKIAKIGASSYAGQPPPLKLSRFTAATMTIVPWFCDGQQLWYMLMLRLLSNYAREWCCSFESTRTSVMIAKSNIAVAATAAGHLHRSGDSTLALW